MQEYLVQELKSSKIKKVGLGYFAFFMFVFLIVDSLNMGYQEMSTAYGIWLVILNLMLSIIMALSTGLLMAMSQVMVGIKGIEAKGSNMGFLSIGFAILTYGCTPYKILTLGLIFIGIFWSYKDIMKGSCNI